MTRNSKEEHPTDPGKPLDDIEAIRADLLQRSELAFISQTNIEKIKQSNDVEELKRIQRGFDEVDEIRIQFTPRRNN